MSIHRWKSYFIHMTLSATVCIPLLVHAADTKSDMPEPSREQREKMALVHEKLAACLRSDRSFEDCHHEMVEAMGGQHCPMMEQTMKGHQHYPTAPVKGPTPANP
jgi:hypothetical protein